VRIIPRQFDAGKLMAPKVIPKNIAMIKERRVAATFERCSRRRVWRRSRGAAGGRSRRHHQLRRVRRSSPASASSSGGTEGHARPRRRQRASAAKVADRIRPIRRSPSRRASNAMWSSPPSSAATGPIQNLQLVGVTAAGAGGPGCVFAVAISSTLLNGEPVEVITQIDVILVEPVRLQTAWDGHPVPSQPNQLAGEEKMFLTSPSLGINCCCRNSIAVGWDVVSLWHQMGRLGPERPLSSVPDVGWSIGVMIDRLIAYSARRKHRGSSLRRLPAPCAMAKLDEAIKIADRYKKSHLAKVCGRGLPQEFRAHQLSNEFRAKRSRPPAGLEPPKPSPRRTEARASATWPPSAPPLVRWTVRHRGRHHHAFSSMANESRPGIGAVAGGISEALVTTAVASCAIPAVWIVQPSSQKIESVRRRDGQFQLGVIDYFLKRSPAAGGSNVTD